MTQCGKATEASEEACPLASVHKALLPSFQHGAASATCPRWPGRSSLQQEQDPALTPWSEAKDNLGEQWLHSPLPCPCRSSFWKLLDSKQRSMPTQSFPSVAHNFWKYDRCAWDVSRHKTVTCVGSIFFSLQENNLIFVMSLRNSLSNDIKLLSGIHRQFTLCNRM